VTSSPAPAFKPDATPALNVNALYLPNPNKPYRVSTHNFLAKSDFTFNFKDGWQLTSIDDKADNSSVTTALVGQMKALLDAAALTPKITDQPLPKTFLLRPEFNAAGIITNIVPVGCENFLTKKSENSQPVGSVGNLEETVFFCCCSQRVQISVRPRSEMPM
jgi:hypothetical protein